MALSTCQKILLAIFSFTLILTFLFFKIIRKKILTYPNLTRVPFPNTNNPDGNLLPMGISADSTILLQ